MKSILGLAITTSLAFGLIGTANAASCVVSDVTIEGVAASSCGWGTTNSDTTDGDTWQVNVDFAGGRTDWALYERETGAEEDDNIPEGDNIHEGNTTIINLISTEIVNDSTQGLMTLNVFNPTLITLKGGGQTLYHWYYFDGITGMDLMGTWNVEGIFGGSCGGSPIQPLEHISAYVVPVPAAVWLFASGLLGLTAMTIRRKTEPNLQS